MSKADEICKKVSENVQNQVVTKAQQFSGVGPVTCRQGARGGGMDSLRGIMGAQ